MALYFFYIFLCHSQWNSETYLRFQFTLARMANEFLIVREARIVQYIQLSVSECVNVLCFSVKIAADYWWLESGRCGGVEREKKPALPGLACSALLCLPSCLPAWGYHIIIASFISLFINIHVALPFTQMAITLTLTLMLTAEVDRGLDAGLTRHCSHGGRGGRTEMEGVNMIFSDLRIVYSSISLFISVIKQFSVGHVLLVAFN